jgi:hypothetical protein
MGLGRGFEGVAWVWVWGFGRRGKNVRLLWVYLGLEFGVRHGVFSVSTLCEGRGPVELRI